MQVSYHIIYLNSSYPNKLNKDCVGLQCHLHGEVQDKDHRSTSRPVSSLVQKSDS